MLLHSGVRKKILKSLHDRNYVWSLLWDHISIYRSVGHDHTTRQSIFMNQNVIGHSFLGFEGRC